MLGSVWPNLSVCGTDKTVQRQETGVIMEHLIYCAEGRREPLKVLSRGASWSSHRMISCPAAGG